jgi:hypothetical protein
MPDFPNVKMYLYRLYREIKMRLLEVICDVGAQTTEQKHWKRKYQP